MSVLNVFPLCKIKRPLVGPFFGRFYFYAQFYKPCLKDAVYKLHLHLDYWFMRRRGLHVFNCISLCKMKRSLVGPFLGGFYFYAQPLQTMSQGCCMSNIRVFRLPVHEKKMFKNSLNVTPLCPLLGPNIGVSPLIFSNLNPHSPNMLPAKFGSNQFSGFEK